jgi:proteasome alpha subunit
MDTAEAVAAAVAALSSASTNINGAGKRTLGVGQLEVAVLDRSRPQRAFRRITGAALTALLPGTDTSTTDPDGDTPGLTPPEQGTDTDSTDDGTTTGH